MGTWGTGNLENDGALDALAEFNQKLFKRIIELLQHPRAHEYDDEEIDELFVTIEVVFALHARGMITAIPQREKLTVSMTAYLERWEAYFRSDGKEPPNERKHVIQETFDQLCDIADKTYKKEC